MRRKTRGKHSRRATTRQHRAGQHDNTATTQSRTTQHDWLWSANHGYVQTYVSWCCHSLTRRILGCFGRRFVCKRASLHFPVVFLAREAVCKVDILLLHETEYQSLIIIVTEFQSCCSDRPAVTTCLCLFCRFSCTNIRLNKSFQYSDHSCKWSFFYCSVYCSLFSTGGEDG